MVWRRNVSEKRSRPTEVSRSYHLRSVRTHLHNGDILLFTTYDNGQLTDVRPELLGTYYTGTAQKFLVEDRDFSELNATDVDNDAFGRQLSTRRSTSHRDVSVWVESVWICSPIQL
jgi:hypothetical protein